MENENTFDGGDLGSIDVQVDEWTARECETRRIEVTVVAMLIA